MLTPNQIIKITLVILFCLSSSAVQSSTCLRGVNIAGAEFGELGGAYGTAYIYPSETTLDWAAATDMTAIRLPFRWERLQPELFGDLDPMELARIQVTVAAANIRGLLIILDPHNYGGYRDDLIGSNAVPTEAFADFWSRFASHFVSNDKVVFGLMNEPAGLTSEAWFNAAQIGITAIRQAGAKNLVLVPGNFWTGASHWFKPQEGGSNAQLFERFVDVQDNFAFEFHQYMDEDFSGTNDSCPRVGDALIALKNVTNWMKKHGFKGFLGEFGGTDAHDCLEGLSKTVGFINENNDVWIGWTAWAAGDWWGNYSMSLQPSKGKNTPQMKQLLPYLTKAPAHCGM